MAEKHPYVTGPGGLVKVLEHFRNSFPVAVDAGTLRKLGYAPKNESYILNVLRHLGLIDKEGNRTEEAQSAFTEHDGTAFAKKFAVIVKREYSGLFDLHADKAWTLDKDALITYFRSTDLTTALVGNRQAATFQLLAAFSGYGDLPETRGSSRSPKTKASPKRKAAASSPKRTDTGQKNEPPPSPNSPTNVGLTVRIEINLPSDGDQKTYDRIFKSIRQNFLNG